MMDETTQNGAGTPAAADTGPDGGAPFLSGLGTDDRALAEENGWRDVGGVLAGYRQMRDRLDQSVQMPGAQASAEDHAAFHARISETWTPREGYSFALPEGLPEDFPYDQAFADEAGGWFREAGLHPAAAQALHDRWLGKMSEEFTAQRQAVQAREAGEGEAAERAHQALVKQHGAPASDGYQNLIAKADRALEGLKSQGVDLAPWFQDKGALTAADQDGLRRVTDPTAVALLAFVHDRAFAEDSLAAPSASAAESNPFAAGTADLKRQSELLESQPARARQLIVAAGRDPKLFRL